MAYQDRWIAGKTTERGDRGCAERYDMVRSIVEDYERQFTVWDLGANLGYFGCRLAVEYGAFSVMVDQRPVLSEVCRENGLSTTIAMTHRLSAQDLWELACSEHVDVVLALNVLHHMEDWRKALPSILALGENVIVETPGVGDVNSANYAESQALLEALWAEKPIILNSHPSHVTPGVLRPMFLFQRPKSAVVASYAYRERVRARGPHPVRPHTIESTLTTKAIHYADGESRHWHHGMNLWNWLQMGGTYPDRGTVQAQARAVAEALPGEHGDFKPWNLILQGQTLKAIDGGHRRSVDDARGLKDTVAWIAEPERAYVAR